jgi:hypothetical protein
MQPSGIITLTTDFGIDDGYVGAMKGVILSIAPQCTVVDISHTIPAQDIRSGAFTLYTAHRFFPPGTVHVAVIDPGVGTERRALLVETKQSYLIGPDNGIFSFILQESPPQKIIELAEAKYFLPGCSATFHGRDIFSPAAAHLSAGAPPQSFGPAADDCTRFPFPSPKQISSQKAQGEIIHIDRFGNLITSLTRSFIKKTFGDMPFRAALKNHTSCPLYPAYGYAHADELFCLFGSSDFLELSIKNGSARKLTGADRGDTVTISLSEPRSG